MSFPQWFVAIQLVVLAAAMVFRTARDRSVSSGMACVLILINLSLYGLFAWVLHDGGFW